MYKNKKNLLILIILLFLLNSCQSAKEAIGGGKKNNTEEFLVEKKNPLVLPPDYDNLPVPKNSSNTNFEDEVTSKEIQKLIGKQENKKKDNENNSLEKSVLKTITEN